MAQPNSVTISEVCRVAPANYSTGSPEELCLPLTFLDNRYFKFPPAERIYYFKLIGLTHTFFHSVVVSRLKSSLSQTLIRFLPLAGHLTWPSDSPKPVILYSPNNDSAVWVTVAESKCADGHFDRLVGNKIHEAAELRPYVPELPVSDSKASTIALQITLFPGKGFSIAITMHHAVLDGKSVSMFFKSWAHTCKHTDNQKNFSLSPELTPSFDRTAIKDPDGLESFFLNHWLATTTSNPRSLQLMGNLQGVPQELARATFLLNRENIKKLKEDRIKKFDPTTFVITYAYVSVCLVKSRGGDSNRKVCLVVTADCRNRLDPPVPQNYFGNCVIVQDIVLEAGDFMEENGVAVIAEKINGLIKGLEKGLFDGARESHERLRSAGAEVQMIGVTGSPRFGYYEEDFGWGKPEKVEIASIDRMGSISLIESRLGNGGIEIGLVMPRHEMEAFGSLFVQGL